MINSLQIAWLWYHLSPHPRPLPWKGILAILTQCHGHFISHTLMSSASSKSTFPSALFMINYAGHLNRKDTKRWKEFEIKAWFKKIKHCEKSDHCETGNATRVNAELEKISYAAQLWLTQQSHNVIGKEWCLFTTSATDCNGLQLTISYSFRVWSASRLVSTLLPSAAAQSMVIVLQGITNRNAGNAEKHWDTTVLERYCTFSGTVSSELK